MHLTKKRGKDSKEKQPWRGQPLCAHDAKEKAYTQSTPQET